MFSKELKEGTVLEVEIIFPNSCVISPRSWGIAPKSWVTLSELR